MLKNLAIFVLLVLAAGAGFIATRPSEFLIVRSRTVAAPPQIVFEHVNDFRQWGAWSPWEKIDPGMMREFSGAPAGPGASYHWSGNDQVGEGRMTITDSQAPNSVTIRLEFMEPFPATNTAQFDIVPGGLGTDVTWSMSGHNNFVAKAFSLFMNMDRMVGGQFERGLADLDTVTAAATPPPAPPEETPPATGEEAPAPEAATPEAAAPEAAAEEAAPASPVP
jgi:Polyketide cyclase / dehydrase and lipid transport